jgi:Tol biopolymer transport system component
LSGKYSAFDICFSPDGKRLYFCSDRPNPWDSSLKTHIWYVERSGGGWSEPIIVASPIYSTEDEQGQPTFTRDGTMYFRKGPEGGFDLYYSRNINGKYSMPIILGNEINTQYHEGKPFIEPDESYLLFIRYGMPASIDGGRGLYISFKRKNGSWTPAKNTNICGSLPKITPDGKYFFFSRGGDIYWVDAKIIEELRPKELR